MIRKIKSSRLAMMIVALVLVSGIFAANTVAAGPGTITMTVTAVGKKNISPPLVTKDDVELYLNKERTQIADWKHGGKLYLAVLDLMKRWPASADRHSILLFSSGIDYFRGDLWTKPTDLDSTVSRAQKQNINVWTIYAPDAGHRGRGFFIANRAQSYLTE